MYILFYYFIVMLLKWLLLISYMNKMLCWIHIIILKPIYKQLPMINTNKIELQTLVMGESEGLNDKLGIVNLFLQNRN